MTTNTPTPSSPGDADARFAEAGGEPAHRRWWRCIVDTVLGLSEMPLQVTVLLLEVIVAALIVHKML